MCERERDEYGESTCEWGGRVADGDDRVSDGG